MTIYAIVGLEVLFSNLCIKNDCQHMQNRPFIKLISIKCSVQSKKAVCCSSDKSKHTAFLFRITVHQQFKL